jgi:hypothetical protein
MALPTAGPREVARQRYGFIRGPREIATVFPGCQTKERPMIESLKFRCSANMLLLIAAMAPLHPAFGQLQCTVHEERRWRTQTAYFPLGP